MHNYKLERGGHLNWVSPLKRLRSALDFSAIEEEKEDEG